MTDDQVLAKVRAAATRGLENMTCLCVGEGGRTPVATCKHCHGSAYLVTDETVSARAALAMVEQYEALLQAQSDADRRATVKYAMGAEEDRIIGHQWRGEACGYGLTASRILSALRTAVGEVQP